MTVCEANFETSVIPSLSNDRECAACPDGKWADYGNAACKDIPARVEIVDNPYFTYQTLFASGIDINVNRDKLVEALGITLNTNLKDIVLINILQSGTKITIKYKVRCLKTSDVLKTAMTSAEFPTNLAATLKSLMNETDTIIINPSSGVSLQQVVDTNWALIITLVCVGIIGVVLAYTLPQYYVKKEKNRIKRV